MPIKYLVIERRRAVQDEGLGGVLEQQAQVPVFHVLQLRHQSDRHRAGRAGHREQGALERRALGKGAPPHTHTREDDTVRRGNSEARKHTVLLRARAFKEMPLGVMVVGISIYISKARQGRATWAFYLGGGGADEGVAQSPELIEPAPPHLLELDPLAPAFLVAARVGAAVAAVHPGRPEPGRPVPTRHLGLRHAAQVGPQVHLFQETARTTGRTAGLRIEIERKGRVRPYAVVRLGPTRRRLFSFFSFFFFAPKASVDVYFARWPLV